MINIQDIFSINTNVEFDRLSLEIFKFQFENNRVYRSYCDLLNMHPSDVKVVEEIPFLPIQFFKTHKVLSSSDPITKTFTSSGTSGNTTSKHYITDLSVYDKSFRKIFKQFYGNVNDYVILALLPSYLEREDSSLVYMVNDLIEHSSQIQSGFYISNHSELIDTIIQLESIGKRSLLIGVSFALLDLIKGQQFNLKNTIVMETGGMKGRRKELIRADLHDQLKNGFGVDEIHSEYGMTELLSQAYSTGKGRFKSPPWMKILIRDTEDALTIESKGKTGGINVIDLANINSCSFISTQDLGRLTEDDSFEILGRFDQSDIRGCNLMAL